MYILTFFQLPMLQRQKETNQRTNTELLILIGLKKDIEVRMRLFTEWKNISWYFYGLKR